MATHHSSPPQSLPSFAQAFSSSSLSNIHAAGNSLPPIQARPSFERFNHHPSPSSREHSRNASIERAPPPSHKRARDDEETSASHSGSDRASPVRIKEEEDHDMPDASPPPPPPPPASRMTLSRPSIDMGSTGSPMPGFLGPPSKKRRTTVTGGPHALNTNIHRAPSQDANGGNTTPISPSVISPAVMGFTIGRDEAAIEQVRSMLTVKQKQKALIEQRRGSVAGILGAQPNHASLLAEQRRGSVAGILTVTPSGNSPRAPGVTRLSAGIVNNHTTKRRSPKAGSTITRRAPPTDLCPPTPSPTILSVPLTASHPPVQIQSATPPESAANQLPPPPISFARRRASQFGPGAAKAKPSDIVISPRDAHPPGQLTPHIQSAPPIPQGQSSGDSSRFAAMTIPRLPTAMDDGHQVQRVTSGRVPPTPTGLTMHRGHSASNAGGPGMASVPISASLVPPTPTSLHRPGYTGGKSAFLAPFEVFYDALNDAKQMKTWLEDQLQKSQALMQTLRHQQEHMEETIDRAVERRMRGVTDEVTNLHTRVEELEGALRLARSEEQMNIEAAMHRRSSIDPFANGKVKAPRGSAARMNGFPPTPDPPAVGYQFPPPPDPAPPPSIAKSPSVRRPEVDRRVSSPGWGHDAGPSHSVSASRYEPPRPQAQVRGQSPSPNGAARRVPAPAGAKNSPQAPPPQRPHRLRSSSSAAEMNGMAGVEETGPPSAPTGRRRRDSVAMSPPVDVRRPLAEEG
ncbi:hypothetical protein FIBSPDRAFT_943306 [Athelia psychrophila]|uniref:Uncharacterized protein n=1 Tax=Athelia psychrophila TaxID=1759441 RepID=A0A166W939_9AGAM|nr:hypothetical protein FIBSPDRAFT_943306 [Fibularhizoctonia sp. CBS 109695]